MATLKKNILSLVILQGSNYIIPLLIFPYLVRVLGPVEYGRIGLATTIIQYFCLFVDFGFNLTASRIIAQGNKTKEEISKVFLQTMTAKAVLLLISIASIMIFSSEIPAIENVDILLKILCLQLIGSLLLPVWFFQGIEKMSSVTISYICAKGISIPLIILFVKDSNDVDIAALIQGGTSLLAGAVSLIFVYNTRLIIYHKIRYLDVSLALKNALPIFIGGIAMSLYTMSNPFVLGIVSNVEQVGLYVASDKLRQALMGAFLILGGALYPRVNALYSKSYDAGFSFVRKIMIIQGGAAFLASAAFYFAAGLISKIMLGSQYGDSVLLLQIMAPMIFLIVMSVILCNYILLPLGHNKLYAKLPIITGIIHLSYSIPLSKFYGAVGSSVSILITEVVTFSLLLTITYKKKYLKSLWKKNETI